MSDISSDLEHLRRRIDDIDDRLQDLLNERIEVVSHIGERKRGDGGTAVYQPAREADILRRLVSRNRGRLPVATLVRMWRELLAATTRLQGSFAVAVYGPPDAPGFWDLARDHYGSHSQMLAYRSTSQVIRAVTEGQAAIGVLPLPDEEGADPWWRHLLSGDENAPRVVARLPFGARGNARSDGDDALAIGRFPLQATGSDRTLITTESAPDISRGRLFSILAGLGLGCTFVAASEHAEGVNTLIEIDGFVPPSDSRFDSVRAQLGPALYRLLWFGGYAVPLPADALSPAERPDGSRISGFLAGAAVSPPARG